MSSERPQGLAVSSERPQGPAVSSAWPQGSAVSSEQPRGLAVSLATGHDNQDWMFLVSSACSGWFLRHGHKDWLFTLVDIKIIVVQKNSLRHDLNSKCQQCP